MRAKTKRICAWPDCGETFDATIGRRFCDQHSSADTDRSSSNPMVRAARQRLYHSKAWKLCRKQVLERDGYLCVICGATELESTLVVDHIGGIDWEDPTNPDKCRTLCLVCSGRVDGKRGTPARTLSTL